MDEDRIVLDPITSPRVEKAECITNHRLVNIALRSLIPKDKVYSQDNITDYEDSYTERV